MSCMSARGRSRGHLWSPGDHDARAGHRGTRGDTEEHGQTQGDKLFTGRVNKQEWRRELLSALGRAGDWRLARPGPGSALAAWHRRHRRRRHSPAPKVLTLLNPPPSHSHFGWERGRGREGGEGQEVLHQGKETQDT